MSLHSLLDYGFVIIGLGLIGSGFGVDILSDRNGRFKLIGLFVIGTAFFAAGVHQFVLPSEPVLHSVLFSTLGIFIALTPLLLIKKTRRELTDFDGENRELIKEQIENGAVELPEGVFESKWDYERGKSPDESKNRVIDIGDLVDSTVDCGWCVWSGRTPLVTIERVRGDRYQQLICPECMMDLRVESNFARILVMMFVTVIGGGGMTWFLVLS